MEFRRVLFRSGFAKVLPNGDLEKTLNEYREAGATILGAKDVQTKIAAMRQVKSPFEVAMIEKAIAATMKGLKAAARTIAPGRSEERREGLGCVRTCS